MNAVVNHPPEIAPTKDMAGRVKTRIGRECRTTSTRRDAQ